MCALGRTVTRGSLDGGFAGVLGRLQGLLVGRRRETDRGPRRDSPACVPAAPGSVSGNSPEFSSKPGETSESFWLVLVGMAGVSRGADLFLNPSVMEKRWGGSRGQRRGEAGVCGERREDVPPCGRPRTVDLRARPESAPSRQLLPGTRDEHPQLEVCVRELVVGWGQDRDMRRPEAKRGGHDVRP